jgi:hypothetical protein
VGKCEEPEKLKHLLDTFSQSKKGQDYWDRKDERNAWPIRKLYERGEGEATDAHPSDVVQGRHSDCFLVAAMAVIVQQHPQPDRWIKEVIKDNGDGSYTVTFYELRPALPYDPTIGGPRAAEYVKVPVTVQMGLYRGAHSDDGGEKWPAVIEKAYAQAYGGEGDQPFTKRDNLGEAMERLTGMPTRYHDPKTVSIERLDAYLRDHHAVKVVSFAALPGFPVPHPAYAPNGLATEFAPAPPPANPPYEPEPPPEAKNTELRQWHEYYVHKVDRASGTVVLHNVHDYGREDIKMPYSEFQTAFKTVLANPIYSRERPR